MDRTFTDKTVIVTGASSGIGAAAARLFSRQGACVVLAARRREAIEAVAVSFPADRTLVVPTDVTDWAACRRLLDQAELRFGRIDVLVNNAGTNARGPMETRTVEELARVVDLNLRSTVVLCRMVLPYLRRGSKGAIVNVASLAGRVPLAGSAVYSGSKFGVRAFSLALADELRGSGITVSVVSPGPVDTDSFYLEMDRAPDLFFVPGMSSAEEVAEAILACALDGRPERTVPGLSRYLTTAAYLWPGPRRVLRPLLEWIGRRRKAKVLRQRGQ